LLGAGNLDMWWRLDVQYEIARATFSNDEMTMLEQPRLEPMDVVSHGYNTVVSYIYTASS
jgi:hypothetical protein